MDTVALQSIPILLRWHITALDWNVMENSILTITAGKLTDLFNDPQGTFSIDNSPRLLFKPQTNFILSARVKVDFRATYDAGVLIIYEDSSHWAKLCFELSPQKQCMIVSVVNQGGASDDCNSMPLNGDETYLRVAKLDHAFAFHFSTDGHFWQLIRYFTLGNTKNLTIGFSTQSPTGNSCTSVFSEIIYANRKLKDIRSGE